MSDKDPVTYLSSEEAKKHLKQLDVEIVQAFSKVFQALPIQSTEEAEISPPKAAKEFIEWLPTGKGKKYLSQIDSSFLKSFLKLVLSVQGGVDPIDPIQPVPGGVDPIDPIIPIIR